MTLFTEIRKTVSDSACVNEEYEIKRLKIKYIYFAWLQVKLATIVESDPKAPFSIATTPMHGGGHYSFP